MSKEEFTYWKAYARKNGPFHWIRFDWNFARIRSALYELNVTEKDDEKRDNLVNPTNHLVRFETRDQARKRLKRKYSEENIKSMASKVESLLGAIASGYKGENNGDNR